MTSQVPFEPLTPAALAKLTEDEQVSFVRAAQCVAEDRIPPLPAIADLLLMVQRLITEETRTEAKLAAITAYCQARADDFNASMPMRVRPQDLRISARDILAIISGEAGNG